MSKDITRTVVKSTKVNYRVIKNGQIGEPQEMTFEGYVRDPFTAIKKELNLDKLDTVMIDDLFEETTLYKMPIDFFMANAEEVK